MVVNDDDEREPPARAAFGVQVLGKSVNFWSFCWGKRGENYAQKEATAGRAEKNVVALSLAWQNAHDAAAFA